MKSNYLYLLAIFLIIFSAEDGNAIINPVVPSDVLNEEEIRQIMDTKDFFFRTTHLEHFEEPLWPHLDRKYSSHSMRQRTQFFSRDDVIHRALSDGFPVQYLIQELLRGSLKIATNIGAIAPHIFLTFGEGDYAINENNLFTGLFSFVLPQNWFQLIQSGLGYDATKYLFLKGILDQYYLAEITYLGLHQLIQDFEIRNFYLIHLQLLDEYLPAGQNDPTVAGTYAQLATDMAVNRGQVRLGFDDLAEVMALRTDQNNLFAADYLNIENLTDFPSRVQQLEELGRFYNNKEDFIVEMLKQSPELKAIKEFFTISKIGIGVTAFGSLFNNVENPDDTDNFSLSFTAGLDTLPKILTSVSLKNTAKIDVQNQFVQMVEAGRRAFDGYVNNIGKYTEAKRSMKLNRKAMAYHLHKILDEGMPADPMFLRDFSNLVDAELKLNSALHGALLAHAWMRRLLVLAEQKFLDYLPEHHQIHKVQRFFLARYPDYSDEGSHMTKTIRGLNNAKELRNFLSGNYRNVDGGLDEFSAEDMKEVVTENMQSLLRRTPLIHTRRKKYYRTLLAYVNQNQINITLYEKRMLMRRAHETVDRVEFEGQHFSLRNCLVDCTRTGRKY